MFKLNLKSLIVVMALLMGLLCSAALVHYSWQPQLPFKIESHQNRLLATADSHNVDTLYQVESINVYRRDHIQRILNRHSFADSLQLTVHPDTTKRIALVKATGSWHLSVKGFAAFVILLLSAIVLWQTRVTGEKYFAIGGGLLALAIALGGPASHFDSHFSIIPALLFLLVLPQAAMFFAYFCYHFPLAQLTPEKLRKRKTILQFSGFGMTIPLWLLYLAQHFGPSPQSFEAFDLGYRILQYALSGLFVFATVVVYRNAVAQGDPVSARKLHWTLAGLLCAGMPLLLFTFLPQWLDSRPLLPVWTIDFFLSLLFTAFFIAILFYRSFNIEPWLNFLLPHSLTIIAFIPLLLSCGYLLKNYLSEPNTGVPIYAALLCGLLIAFGFEPLRRLFVPYIDRHLFPLRKHRLNIRERTDRQLAGAFTRRGAARACVELLTASVSPRHLIVAFREGIDWYFEGNATIDDLAAYRDWFRKQHHLPQDLSIDRNSLERLEQRLQLPIIDLPEGNWVLFCPIDADAYAILGCKSSGDLYWQEDCESILLIAEKAERRLLEVEQFKRALPMPTPETRAQNEAAVSVNVDQSDVSEGLQKVFDLLEATADSRISESLRAQTAALLNCNLNPETVRLRTAVNRTIKALPTDKGSDTDLLNNSCPKSHRIKVIPGIFDTTLSAVLQSLDGQAEVPATIDIHSRIVTENGEKRIELCISGDQVNLPSDLPLITPNGNGKTVSANIQSTAVDCILNLAALIDTRLTVKGGNGKPTRLLISLPRA